MDYLSIALQALNLITEYGQSMTLTRQTAGTYSAESGSYSATTDTDYTVQGVVLSPNMQGYGDRYFAGTTVQAGDRFVLLAASGMAVAPQGGDTLTIGGESYSVVTSMPVSPAGTDLLYRLLIRK